MSSSFSCMMCLDSIDIDVLGLEYGAQAGDLAVHQPGEVAGGIVGAGGNSTPTSRICLTSAGSARVSLMAALSLSTMAGGVPRGANSAFQERKSMAVLPLLCAVATLGRPGKGSRVSTATARTRPLAACASEVVVWSHMKSVSPPISPVMAGATPL